MHTDAHIDGDSGWVSVIQGRREEEGERDCREGEGEEKSEVKERKKERENILYCLIEVLLRIKIR